MRVIGPVVLMLVLGGCSGGNNGGSTPPAVIGSAPVSTQAGITARSGLAGSPVTPYVNDADFPETFSFQVLSSPANGTASVVNNRLVYTPNVGFTSGLDNFTYRATDSNNNTIDGTARVRVYENTPAGSSAGLGRCTTASTVNPDGTLGSRINITSCAFYGEANTRVTSTGVPVTVRYAVQRPSNGALPKAVVILIAGGNLNANFAGGDALTGNVTATGGNFVIRTAQLVAEAGYLAVVMNRPSDRADVAADVDAYRISVDHAVDMLAVVRLVNTDNLPLILAGTSRGAMSVVANNLIASGIQMSSPVTSGAGLFVGNGITPNLQATYVQRPTRVLWHQGDLCLVSTPANSQILFNNLSAHLSGIGVSSSSASVAGGVRVTMASANVTPDVCGAFDFHGFLGIEPTVIAAETIYLDNFISTLSPNTIPNAAFATVETAAGVVRQINLATLSSDVNNDTLSYTLAHSTTSLGGSVALNGAIVTYTPPAATSNKTDYFVYVVTDGNGGVRAAVVTVQIGS